MGVATGVGAISVEGDELENHVSGLYQAICIVLFIFYLIPLGTNLGKKVCAQQSDGKDNQDKRDDKLHQCGQHLTNLQSYATHNYLELSDTLACGRGRCQKRSDDTIGQRSEELRHNTSQVECSSQYDNILRIQHVSLYSNVDYFFRFKLRMKGGILIAQGADTCVYDPVVDCAPGSKPVPPGDYVSRLVRKDDKEVANQTQVKEAIDRIQKKFPGKSIASQFNVAVAQCNPVLKESDLKSSIGRYCSARQRRLDAVEKSIDYVNLITPRQELDMYKLPKEFVYQTLPDLLHAVAYLNNENVIHSDAHAGNIAKMGDKLVLHDWGRCIIGLKQFKEKMIDLLEDPDEMAYLESNFQQWKFPCKLLDTCILPKSPDATFHRFMKMYDTISILGSASIMKFIDQSKADQAFRTASHILTSNVHPNQTMPLVHAMIDAVFSTQSQAPTEPLSESLSISSISNYTSDPDKMYSRGGVRITSKRFCKCVKSVDRTMKQKERSPIAICVASMLHPKGKTLKKFRCGRKPKLVTQKKKRKTQ